MLGVGPAGRNGGDRRAARRARAPADGCIRRRRREVLRRRRPRGLVRRRWVAFATVTATRQRGRVRRGRTRRAPAHARDRSAASGRRSSRATTISIRAGCPTVASCSRARGTRCSQQGPSEQPVRDRRRRHRPLAHHDRAPGGEEPSVTRPTAARSTRAGSSTLPRRGQRGRSSFSDGAMPADTVDPSRGRDRVRWRSPSLSRRRAAARSPAGVPADHAPRHDVRRRARSTNLTRGRLRAAGVPEALRRRASVLRLGRGGGWSAARWSRFPTAASLFSMDENGTGNFDLFACDADGANLMPVTMALARSSSTRRCCAAAAAAAAVLRQGWPDPPTPALPHDGRAGDDRRAHDALRLLQRVRERRRGRAVPLTARRSARTGASVSHGVAAARRRRRRQPVLLREAPVPPQGGTWTLAPSDLPMFEQIVDANGARAAGLGPTHVAGFNWTRPAPARSASAATPASGAARG